MKNLTPRTWSLIFAGIALVALVLLAASLNALQLEPGRAVPEQLPPPGLYDSSIPSEVSETVLAFFRGLLVVAWVLGPLYVIYLVLSKEARKRFLRDMIAFLPIIALLLILSSIQRQARPGEDLSQLLGQPTGEVPAVASTPIPPLPEYVPPPAWVTTAAAVALGLAVTATIAGITYFLLRRARLRQLEPLQIVALEAQAALDSIQSGGDLRDAILRAYAQMVEAVRQHRNISRDEDMTPHEFEQLLEKRGLPAGPVHQLTELFEQVRYGGQAPGRQQEHAAIASLSAIVSACQKKRGQ